jgi:hypothetical protein|tara:strand:- start:13 stop:402 length:390 start_codon:yes stop_codon:yes gene_type:complete
METKGELVENIREWVKIDNEIRTLQKEINTRKDEKKKISAALMQTMKSNEIDCFDINNGQIQYVNKKVKKPMTKKVLFDVLTKYYDGDFLKANQMKDFIMDNREETSKESISRKISSKASATSNTNSIE